MPAGVGSLAGEVAAGDRGLTGQMPAAGSADVLAEACRGRMARPAAGRVDQPIRESRREARIPFDCPVRWSDGGVDRHGVARDVSETGASFLVRSISRPVIGQTLRLVFELTAGYEWVVDEWAVVTRCDPGPDGLCDVGVRLTDIERYPADAVPARPRRVRV